MSGPETEFVAEPDTHDMTTTATIDAAPEVVYRAFTETELLVQWWGPAELTSDVKEFDMRPGGRWRVVQTDPDGNAYGFHGVIHSVEPDERIVQTFEFEGMPGHVCLQTLTLEKVEGGTRVTEHAVFQSVADRDGMAETGARDFAPVGMAQLAEVVASL